MTSQTAAKARFYGTERLTGEIRNCREPRANRAPDRRLAIEYAYRFELQNARSHYECSFHTQSRVLTARGWRTERGWRHVARPLGIEQLVASMRDSQTRYAPGPMTAVRHLVIDLDAHDVVVPRVLPETNVVNGVDAPINLEAFLAAGASRGEKNAIKRASNDAARSARANALRPAVDAIVAALSGVMHSVFIETTPRGAHVIVMLAHPAAADIAAAAARALAAVATKHTRGLIGVEAFPRIESGMARHCALPLLGPARRRKADLVTADGSKRAAFEALIAAPGVSPAQLLRLTSSGSQTDLTGHAELAVAPGTRCTSADGQLFGSAFVEESLRILREGMANDESYSAIRRLYASGRYVGLSHRETRDALGVFIERPIHQSTRANSARGRRHLRTLIHAQGMHFARGEAKGTAWQGGCRSEALSAVFAELLHESLKKRHEVHSPEAPAAC